MKIELGLILGLSMTVCEHGRRKSSESIAASTPPATGDAEHPRAAEMKQSSELGSVGDECEASSECFPQALAHATWCAPTRPQHPATVTESYVARGTLDLPWWKARPPGCRCVRGFCGALLNDGRLVIGRQPEFQNTSPE